MESQAGQSPLLRFGPFELDLASGELRKAGVPLKLAPQPFKVLALLAGRAGRPVMRQEIREQVWGRDTYVDFEQGLNSCIKQIRAALGDDAEKPRYIETLPRRGYRFIVPVEKHPWKFLSLPNYDSQIVAVALTLFLSVAAYVSYRRLVPTLSPQSDRIMLAVLPFENFGPAPGPDRFSDGLTEETITQLGRLEPRRLGVIARTSAMKYKGARKSAEQIGRELGVDFILEGSVRMAGRRVRISAQLIQVRDQTHLWAETYEGDLNDVLAVQSEIARRITRSLAVELLPAPQSAMPRLVRAV